MDTRSFLLPTQVDHGEHACAVAAEDARGCKGVSIPTVPVGCWGPGTGESHPRRQTGITHATAAHRLSPSLRNNGDGGVRRRRRRLRGRALSPRDLRYVGLGRVGRGSRNHLGGSVY